MNTLLITYNLNRGDNNYEDLFGAIRGFGNTWHDASQLDSVWFVRTNLTPTQASEKLASVLDDEKDRWVVFDVTGQARQGWISKSLWEFLQGA
jgi:hypothetical protein